MTLDLLPEEDNEKEGVCSSGLKEEERCQKRFKEMNEKIKESEKARKDNPDKYFLKDCKGE